MEIILKADAEEMAAEAYEILAGTLARKPNAVLGLATGRTPLGLYRLLRESRLDFSKVRLFNLDEFVGLSPDHASSFHRFLSEQLVRHVSVRAENVRFLRGDVRDLRSECASYEEAISTAGGIDVQILGVGRNGHVAFNEPGSSLGSRTRVKALEESTLNDYARAFGSVEATPRFSLTVGVGTIMEARRVLVLAAGAEKAEIVHRMVEGPVTAGVPGSALQFHPNATMIVDEAAGSLLTRKEYWRWVYANKWRVAP